MTAREAFLTQGCSFDAKVVSFQNTVFEDTIVKSGAQGGLRSVGEHLANYLSSSFGENPSGIFWKCSTPTDAIWLLWSFW